MFVDVTNAPSWEDQAGLTLPTTSATNQLKVERAARAERHVALSIVGTDEKTDSGYLRAKVAQEHVIKELVVPYTIVRSTKFDEFVPGIAQVNAQGDTINLTDAFFGAIAADDVARLALLDPSDPGAWYFGTKVKGVRSFLVPHASPDHPP